MTSYQDPNDNEYSIPKPSNTGEEAIKEMTPNPIYRSFDTEVESPMAVLEGEVDAFVYDLPFNAVFTAMHKDSDLLFLDEPFTGEELAWAIRKDDPGFRDWLNRFLAELKAEGQYDRIYERWFRRRDWFA